MAITADRNTQSREGVKYKYPMEATTHLYAGQMIALNASGNAEAASAAASKICVGRATEEVNNTGAAAAKSIEVEAGVFKWDNSGGLTKTSIGDTVYMASDVAVKASGVGTSPVGIMVDIEADGVWVKTDAALAIGSSGLLAANNLSDVGSAATSRTNLGLGTIATQAANNVTISGGSVTGITDLAVADGGTAASTAAAARTSLGCDKIALSCQTKDLLPATVGQICVPIAGTIAKIRTSLLGHALAVGDATLTATIGGVAVTDGVVTITQAGSAIGDVDSATPSAANVVAAGDKLTFTVGGANTDAAAWADIQVLITPA